MRGYGKIIIFGEHAVVYGYPALAASIGKGVTANTESGEDVLVVDNLSFCSSEQPDSLLTQVFLHILGHFPDKPCQVNLQSEIPFGAGLGSSAATCVAIVRALVDWHGCNWDSEKVNKLAFSGEKIFHGTPSGLDNTIACFGGFCYLRDPNKFAVLDYSPMEEVVLGKLSACLMKPSVDINFVVINTGKERKTQDLVARVRCLVEKNSSYYHEVMSEIGRITQVGWECICRGDTDKLGKLMKQNQQCLQKLEVSCSEIESVCEACYKSGAIGAKLTGAGGGGCVIALAPGKESDVQRACKKIGFDSFIARIGVG